MTKVAIIVLAGTESREGLGRVVNALMAVKEFKEHDDNVRLIFDGAGTTWIAQLSNPDHKYNSLYEKTKDKITGVCSYCSTAYGALENIKQADLTLDDSYEGHPSFKALVEEGFHIITF